VNYSGLTPASYKEFSLKVRTLDAKYISRIIPVRSPDTIYFEKRHLNASEIEVVLLSEFLNNSIHLHHTT
jgi:hypothetical protein